MKIFSFVLLVCVFASLGCNGKGAKEELIPIINKTNEQVNENTDFIDENKEDIAKNRDVGQENKRAISRLSRDIKEDTVAGFGPDSAFETIRLGGHLYHVDKGYHGPSQIEESVDVLIETKAQMDRMKSALKDPERDDLLEEVGHIREDLRKFNRRMEARHRAVDARFDGVHGILEKLSSDVVTVDELEASVTKLCEKLAKLDKRVLTEVLPAVREAYKVKTENMARVEKVIFGQPPPPTVTVFRSHNTYTSRSGVPMLHRACWFNHRSGKFESRVWWK